LSYSPSVYLPLLHFFMQRMFAAKRTIFFYFQPLGLFLFIPGS